MWICTNKGFLSIVAHRDKPGYFMVRARRRPDLKFWVNDAIEILETPDADYRYRAVINRKELNRLMDCAMDQITYDNFKSSVKDTALHDAYMGFWSIMYRLQK